MSAQMAQHHERRLTATDREQGRACEVHARYIGGTRAVHARYTLARQACRASASRSCGWSLGETPSTSRCYPG
jgi:hypothetical protein